MQSYRTAQQAVGIIFERCNTVSFEEAISSYAEDGMEKEEFLGNVRGFLGKHERMISEFMEFFLSKTRPKILTVEELKEANPELTEEEMELMLRNQNSKEAKKAEKKAASDAKKAEKKAESDAKKAAKKAESEAKKAEKKAESEGVRVW